MFVQEIVKYLEQSRVYTIYYLFVLVFPGLSVDDFGINY